MRPGQQKQRGRSRNGGGNQSSNNNNNNNQRKGQNPLTRTYDSSGPDVKIRGTAQHIAEKYMALARDATSSGDRVMAENYLQHAEHYNRIIAAAQAMFQERFQRDERAEIGDRDDDDAENTGNVQPGESAESDTEAQPQQPQPQIQAQPQPQPQQQPQPRPQPKREHQPRQPRPNLAEQPQPVIIDQSTPQPVFEETPAEVQMEQEAAVGEQAERPAPRRRSNAGRPRRTPRQPSGEGETAEAPAPVDVPAE